MRALLSGHQSCCFGTSYTNNNMQTDLNTNIKTDIISWSSDGTIRRWNSATADGLVNHDMYINSNNCENNDNNNIFAYKLEKYPIYDCAYNCVDNNIVCAGGGSGSFLGHPVHVIKGF